MLISLAWKNVWRNKKRSLIVILAIMFGLWGGLFSGAMMIGMGESMVNTAIDRDISHIQIHQKEFIDSKDINLNITDESKLLKEIKMIPGVKAVSGRVVFEAMASSPKSSYGIKVTGINPEQEKQVTKIQDRIKEGNFFNSKKRNPIVIGEKLSEALGIKLNSKLILSFQGLNGEIVYIACKVIGIYKTNSSLFDKSNVFLKESDIYRILNSKKMVHEIAIRANMEDLVSNILVYVKKIAGNLSVESWKEIAPDLAYVSTSMMIFTYLFVAIIILALVFGITNTMLMAVVDRTHEFGVLTAVGMKKIKIFFLIILETVFLSITGAMLGILLTITTVSYYNSSGIDLSFVATSLESFGASSMVYPQLPVNIYFTLTIMVIFAANISAILPALKVIKLNPSQAIREY